MQTKEVLINKSIYKRCVWLNVKRKFLISIHRLTVAQVIEAMVLAKHKQLYGNTNNLTNCDEFPCNMYI